MTDEFRMLDTPPPKKKKKITHLACVHKASWGPCYAEFRQNSNQKGKFGGRAEFGLLF